MQRPDPNEHSPYYGRYIDQVEDGDILETLVKSVAETVTLLRDVPADWTSYRYEPEKWTLGEVVGHVIDMERVFAYRALAIARGETADLPGADENGYAAASNAAERDMASLLDELKAVRGASLALFANLDPAARERTGRANGSEVSVRTFPWLVAGHEIHHRKVIVERYLEPLSAGES